MIMLKPITDIDKYLNDLQENIDKSILCFNLVVTNVSNTSKIDVYACYGMLILNICNMYDRIAKKIKHKQEQKQEPKQEVWYKNISINSAKYEPLNLQGALHLYKFRRSNYKVSEEVIKQCEKYIERVSIQEKKLRKVINIRNKTIAHQESTMYEMLSVLEVLRYIRPALVLSIEIIQFITNEFYNSEWKPVEQLLPIKP